MDTRILLTALRRLAASRCSRWRSVLCARAASILAAWRTACRARSARLASGVLLPHPLQCSALALYSVHGFTTPQHAHAHAVAPRVRIRIRLASWVRRARCAHAGPQYLPRTRTTAAPHAAHVRWAGVACIGQVIGVARARKPTSPTRSADPIPIDVGMGWARGMVACVSSDRAALGLAASPVRSAGRPALPIRDRLGCGCCRRSSRAPGPRRLR